MLPTKGYFQDIDCPYYDSQCGRPYCHFRHKRKQSESGSDSPKECEVPSYKPTPKSQLANNRSHIPISYVPDLAFRPERTVRNTQKFSFEKPIYKPTPLSILSSANKLVKIEQQTNEDRMFHTNTVDEMEENIANTEYKPVNVNSDTVSLIYTPTINNNQSCEVLPSNEYKPVGENCSHLQYNPTNSNTKIDDTSETHYVPSGGNPSEAMYSPTNQSSRDLGSHMIDFEDFSNEFDMIDEIISDNASDLEKTHLPDVDNKGSIHDVNQIDKSGKSISFESDKNKFPCSRQESKYKKFSNTKSGGDFHSQSDFASQNPKTKSSKHKSDSPYRDKKSEHLDKNREKHNSPSKSRHKSSAVSSEMVNLKRVKKGSSKDDRKESSKDDNKKYSKDDRKDSLNDDRKNISKDDNKKYSKDDSKESSNDDRKDSSKEDKKCISKEDKKDSSQGDRKDISKSESKDVSKGERREKGDRKEISKGNKKSSSKGDRKDIPKSDKKDSSKDVGKGSSKNDEDSLKNNGKGSLKNNGKTSSKDNGNKSLEDEKTHCDTKKVDSKKKSNSSNSIDKSKYRNRGTSRDREKKYRESGQHRKKDKEKEHEKHKDKNRKSARKYKSKSNKEPSKLEIQGKEMESEKSVVSNSPILDEIDDYNFDFELDDDIDDGDTLQECYRIFNEYKPPETISVPETSVPNVQKTKILEIETAAGKKRVAHTNAEKIALKIHPSLQHPLPTAAKVMTNRFKLARLAQANNEQINIISAVKNLPTKRSAPPSLMAAIRNYKIQKTLKDAHINSPKTVSTSLVDQILNKSQITNNAIAKFSQRKIAPVLNVLSFQKAKERIDEMKQKAADNSKRTAAKTVKDGKRVAHMPEFSLAEIPDVLQADKSKLPVNVRTRFLTMIAEECGKLYLIKEDAYTRALNEEFSCYEKCKVLITYKNSAMLAVNRIRKEHQEREKQGLGPIYSGEDSATGKVSDYSGKKFHDKIRRYIMSDEDLELHGYPKESNIPGKAVIKNRKLTVSMNLEEYQRKCARCSKIYVVDEDGFAFYEEECLYHPLKKRTLRGEQTYLCCKSSDDMGCVTSHTHVSECTDESELEGYQTTMEPENDNDSRSFAVYALDCEMCYTTKGLELTRVTIVDCECKTVYDSLVKPLSPIIDYNTRFSGITKEQMDRTSTSILQVQANILHLCNSETILIGHSLESDLKALKIIHGNIIDTSVLFPHRLGLPHKRALRALASEYLEKIIQNDISGHDSAEDAITCMELIKWKLKEELKVRTIK